MDLSVSEEKKSGSSSLKRRNLRCGGEAIGLRAAAEPLVCFFSTAQTNGRAVSLHD